MFFGNANVVIMKARADPWFQPNCKSYSKLKTF